MGVVLGVVGGSGGIGASRFAAVLAAVAGAAFGRSLLVDLDPGGGGLDVALGAELVPGPRWSGLRLAGGVLDAEGLLSGLPAWGRAALLACDRAALPPPEQVLQVLDAGQLAAHVVVDLGRSASAARTAALDRCTCVVLLSGCDLAAVTAARSFATELGDGRPVALVVRGGRAAAGRASTLIGAPLAARLPARRGRDVGALDPERLPRTMQRVARGVLAGLAGLAGSDRVDIGGWVPELEVVS